MPHSSSRPHPHRWPGPSGDRCCWSLEFPVLGAGWIWQEVHREIQLLKRQNENNEIHLLNLFSPIFTILSNFLSSQQRNQTAHLDRRVSFQIGGPHILPQVLSRSNQGNSGRGNPTVEALNQQLKKWITLDLLDNLLISVVIACLFIMWDTPESAETSWFWTASTGCGSSWLQYPCTVAYILTFIPCLSHVMLLKLQLCGSYPHGRNS